MNPEKRTWYYGLWPQKYGRSAMITAVSSQLFLMWRWLALLSSSVLSSLHLFPVQHCMQIWSKSTQRFSIQSTQYPTRSAVPSNDRGSDPWFSMYGSGMGMGVPINFHPYFHVSAHACVSHQAKTRKSLYCIWNCLLCQANFNDSTRVSRTRRGSIQVTGGCEFMNFARHRVWKVIFPSTEYRPLLPLCCRFFQVDRHRSSESVRMQRNLC